MKITYLKLKNFSTIFSAMGKKEIEIDFSKCTNRIVLLVGDNGSGKTSILSALHPFAYPGNMDVRSGSNLILADEKGGYKEIHYDVNGTEYIIKHNYKNASNGKVLLKSHISKDGEELNPNGNVTSFIDTVSDELCIEQDFLKLLRLGSNVTNMIEMKATDRKNFTSELLSDIGIYNTLYKKVSDDSRLLKGFIKNVADKMDKLNVSDRDLLESDISTVEQSIDELTAKKSELEKELGYLQGVLSSSFPNGETEFLNEVKSNRDKLDELNKSIHKLDKKVDKSYKLDDAVNTSNEYNVKIRLLEQEIEICNNDTNRLMNELNELNKEYDKLKDSLNLYYKIKDRTDALEERLEDYSDFDRSKPEFTDSDVETCIALTVSIQDVINTICGYDKKLVDHLIAKFELGINVSEYIKELLMESTKYDTTKRLQNYFDNSGFIVYKPENCISNDCPVLEMYRLMINDIDDSDTTFSISEIEDMKNIWTSVEYIGRLVNANASSISKLQTANFDLGFILEKIKTGKRFANTHIYVPYKERLHTYEAYVSIVEQLDNYKREAMSLENPDTMKRLRRKIDNMISTVEESKFRSTDLVSSLKDTKDKKEKLDLIIEVLKEKTRLETEFSEIKTLLDSSNKIIQANSLNINRKQEINTELDQVTDRLRFLDSKLFGLKYTLKEYDELNKEKTLLRAKFEDVSIIRESLSSTKGIPLLFIQLYLKNTRLFVNSLLESVYGETFEIDDFDINASEFNIPYYKNGVRVPDVVHSSQGEKSFLSLALSFALINQSIKDYNILLLDEIDSTLDIRNRALFLNILEKQMQLIDAEQIFLITHNNMFHNYPVDVILTSDNQLTDYSDVNVIYTK